MNKNKIAITLGIVCVILTIAICVQVKTIQNANSTVSKTLAENGLRDEVLKWKERYDNISEELDNREKQLAKIREESTQDDTISSEKEVQITQNNNLLGITNLVGQGIEMTITDNPTATSETIPIFDDISRYIVHDADIRALVNELKMQEQKQYQLMIKDLLILQQLHVFGNVIKVNDERITSPFTIKAIGYPESLVGIDRVGGYIEKLRESGIVVNIKKQNKINIPKYSGVISSKYMRLQK